jgi:SnoaL-like domain
MLIDVARVYSSSLHDPHGRRIFSAVNGGSPVTFRVGVRSTSSSRVRACARVPILLSRRIKIMNALEVSQRSLDAWNRHDADAIVALYAEGGTYSAPRAGQALTGQAIAKYVKALSTAYPDFSLETISSGDTGGGLVATQWVFHATHTGPYFDGSPLPVALLPFRGLPSFRLRATCCCVQESALRVFRYRSSFE